MDTATPNGPREWLRRHRSLLRMTGVVVVIGLTIGSLPLINRYVAHGFCDATDEIRLDFAGAVGSETGSAAIADAQIAVADEHAPALRERAGRLMWSDTDLADEIATALEEVAATRRPGDQTEPLLQFIRLANEFAADNCRENF